MGELTTLLYQQTDEDLPDDDLYSDAVFLSADAVYVDTIHNSSTQWNISVTVGAHPVVFKVDTGAEATALSEKTYNLLHESVPQLQKSTHKLCGANRAPLDVLGVTKMKLIYNSKPTTQEVFVIIRDLQHNLLGLPAIRDLEIITGINTVELNIPDQYPALSTGLGTFKGEYTIELKPDAEPFSLFTPRNVPIPLQDKVKQELHRMESIRVISRVNEQTP